jgi:glycosyltransferase involved in cell wall biosynthesis
VWYEPFGLIVIESLAQGTPVIVNNAGALPELVEQSGGGIVYDSPAALCAALQRLSEDQSLAGTLGERGREAYHRLWTEERHLQRYFEIIDEQLQRRA